MKRVDKKLVGRQFRRAMATYDSQAMIQYRVAEHLLTLLGAQMRQEPERVLEIGCCTGLLTRRLTTVYPHMRELVINDLVPALAEQAAVAAHPIIPTILAGDIENTSLDGPFDLIISSSTFHWLHDLPELLLQLAANLKLGGWLAFSMYGSDNLREIKALTGIGLDYYSLEEIKTMVSASLSINVCEEQRLLFPFSHPLEVLNHLRQTGVNGISKKPWNRSQVQEFCTTYSNSYSDAHGVYLTYHPLYCVATASHGD